MIFAPRSWPSRPGFAMTTRIVLATATGSIGAVTMIAGSMWVTR